jgi:intracellular sulfur oxidation DsrE/DsrF family protein
MEDQMDHLMHVATDLTPRRGFLGRVASAMALGLAGLMPTPSHAQTAPAPANGPDWPGALKGRHRQVVDAYEANSGFPLAFAFTFLAPHGPPNASAPAATAVVVLRHGAFPIALDNEMWRKYKIGEAFKIIDPETKAPAVKNPFLRPKPGVLLVEDMALDRLLANGVVFGACNVALQVQSKMLAANGGVSAEEAAKEWAANIVPGVTVIPSGTWGVNRAQEGGCTYCAGG